MYAPNYDLPRGWVECRTCAGTHFFSSPKDPRDVYHNHGYPHTCPDGWHTLDRSTDKITVYRPIIHSFTIAGEPHPVTFQVFEIDMNETPEENRGTWTIVEATYTDPAGIVHEFDYHFVNYDGDGDFSTRSKDQLLALYRSVWCWLEERQHSTPSDNYAKLPSRLAKPLKAIKK